MDVSTRSNAVKSIVAAALLAVGGAGGLLVSLEGESHTAYLDTAGVPTLCNGHTEGVHLGDKATADQCAIWRKEDLRKAQAPVDKGINVPVNKNEYIAYLSFTYNVGGKAFLTSKSVLAKLNAGDHAGACKGMLQWVYAGGAYSKGLKNRRDVEVAICLTPSKEMIQ